MRRANTDHLIFHEWLILDLRTNLNRLCEIELSRLVPLIIFHVFIWYTPYIYKITTNIQLYSNWKCISSQLKLNSQTKHSYGHNQPKQSYFKSKQQAT